MKIYLKADAFLFSLLLGCVPVITIFVSLAQEHFFELNGRNILRGYVFSVLATFCASMSF